MNRYGRELAGPISLGMDSARAEYSAAKATTARARARGLAPMGSGADYHYRSESDYLRMTEFVRDLDRNNQIIGQGIDRLIDLVFRDGMLCDPDTGNDELDEILDNDWRAWATDRDRCDIAGKLSVHGMARLAARHRVVDGDHFVLPLESGHLQGVEGHRGRTPRNARNRKEKVVHGIVMDGFRRPKEYWFTKDDIGLDCFVERVEDMAKVRAYDAAGHRQVFHIYDPKRMSQTRGVSALAPVLETAAQHDDLQFTTLVKAQVAACFAVLVEQGENAKAAPTGGALGARTVEAMPDGFQKVLEQLAPGMVYRGKPGEKINGYTPNVPNAEFFEHSRLILTFVAVNLGIPVMALLLDPRETNFSGWRAAMEMALVGIRRFRTQMIEQFYRPIYEWRVRRMLAENPRAAELSEAEGVYAFRHYWKPPRDPYIEPSKDAAADKLIVESGLDSRRNVLGARGLDIAVVDRDRVDDQKKLILLALAAEEEIKRRFPVWDGTWRDLMMAALLPPMAGGLPVEAEEEDLPQKNAETAKKKTGKQKGNADA